MEMSYIWGLLGGLMIGSAGALLMLGTGRIMGASGIFGSVIDGRAWGAERVEKVAFLAGLIGLPAIVALIFGATPTGATENIAVILAGGLAVGVGTRLANGCTSGHGVCGISRLSMRGIVATLIYLGAGMMTVALFRHGLGLI